MKHTVLPTISIVMPIYNSAEFLRASIASLQHQTFTNWELIAIDDFSTDTSWEILQSFAAHDSRLHIYRNQENLGVAATANKALKLVQAQYIARMDSDDVAEPDRLQLQLDYLQTHPDVVAVGGQCTIIDRYDRPVGIKHFPTQPTKVSAMLFRFASLQQPTMMVNAELLPDDFVWYDSGLNAAEEHELLFKLRQYGQLANLPQTILQYRMHDHNVSKQHPKKDFWVILAARIKAVTRYGYRPSVLNIIVNLLQLVTIGLLPEFLIHPLYRRLRGFNHAAKAIPTLTKKAKISSLSVFFPLHNEAENIEPLVAKALAIVPTLATKWELILVNDGSTDQTSKLAHQLATQHSQIKVIDQVNLGYGGALKTGFTAAQYEWIFFSDGDLQFDLRELALLIPETKNHKIVIGHRLHRADPLKRRIMAGLLKIWNRFFFRFPSHIKDIDCAFKLFHRSVVNDIFPLYSRGAMISTEMLLKASDAGYAIAQVGVTHLPRLHGAQTGARWDVVWGAVKETYHLCLYRAHQTKPTSQRLGYSFPTLPVLIALTVTTLFGWKH